MPGAGTGSKERKSGAERRTPRRPAASGEIVWARSALGVRCLGTAFFWDGEWDGCQRVIVGAGTGSKEPESGAERRTRVPGMGMN